MRNTTIFIIFLFLLSCNSIKKDYQKRTDLFENHIGKENAKELTKLTNEFEEFLKEKYPNETLDSAYTSFLRNIKSGISLNQMLGINIKWEKQFRKIIDQSSFKNEIYLYTDSVWLDENEIKCIYSYRGQDSVPNETGAIMIIPGDNEDSIRKYMDELKKSKEFNIYGKYYTGLNLIKGQDSVIIRYLAAKYSAGEISPQLFAKGFLYSKPDFNDYFYKRILIVELLY